MRHTLFLVGRSEFQRKLDVLDCRQHGDQVQALEDEADGHRGTDDQQERLHVAEERYELQRKGLALSTCTWKEPTSSWSGFPRTTPD